MKEAMEQGRRETLRTMNTSTFCQAHRGLGALSARVCNATRTDKRDGSWYRCSALLKISHKGFNCRIFHVSDSSTTSALKRLSIPRQKTTRLGGLFFIHQHCFCVCVPLPRVGAAYVFGVPIWRAAPDLRGSITGSLSPFLPRA